jgi:hypothetical protein
VFVTDSLGVVRDVFVGKLNEARESEFLKEIGSKTF